MEHIDAEAHFLSHHYCDRALMSEGFTGLALPGTISVFSHGWGREWIWMSDCTLETELCIFLACFRKGIFDSNMCKAHYHFLSYLCQCPHQYCCERKENKRVNQTEADVFTLPYCIEYNNIEVSYGLLLIFQVLLWWRELEINLKIVLTFKSTTLRVYKDREGK